MTNSRNINEGRPRSRNPAALYLASLEAATSRRTMRGVLQRVANMLVPGTTLDTFPWEQLRYSQVVSLRATLLEDLAPATVNKYLCGVRRVALEACRLGLMEPDVQQAIGNVAHVKGQRVPAGRAITAGELRALIAACVADPSPAGIRDGAAIAVLYSCGLRRAELVGLDVGDYDLESGALVVRGKRSKERLAYAVKGTADALADWLAIRGEDPGPLFGPVRRGGHLQAGHRLSAQAIYRMLHKRAAEAGVEDLSPHDLRRTFVGDLLDAGADISTVQRLAGHANVQTTARYDRRPESAKRKAVQLLHVPYRRRTLAES